MYKRQHEHLRYSREARAYTLMVLLVLLMVLLALRALRDGRRRDWVGAGALAALTYYAQPVAVFPVGAALLAVALAHLPPPGFWCDRGWAVGRRSLAGLGLAALAGLVVGVPALWSTIEIMGKPFPGSEGTFFDAEGRESLSLSAGSWWLGRRIASWLGPGEPALFALTAALSVAGLVASFRRNRAAAWSRAVTGCRNIR